MSPDVTACDFKTFNFEVLDKKNDHSLYCLKSISLQCDHFKSEDFNHFSDIQLLQKLKALFFLVWLLGNSIVSTLF